MVNEPLESISADLGFSGNTLAEGTVHSSPLLILVAFLQFFIIQVVLVPLLGAGLVVSICLGGAFIGCLFSGSVADGIGRRRAFQLSALPMIIGAAIR